MRAHTRQIMSTGTSTSISQDIIHHKNYRSKYTLSEGTARLANPTGIPRPLAIAADAGGITMAKGCRGREGEEEGQLDADESSTADSFYSDQSLAEFLTYEREVWGDEIPILSCCNKQRL